MDSKKVELRERLVTGLEDMGFVFGPGLVTPLAYPDKEAKRQMYVAECRRFVEERFGLLQRLEATAEEARALLSQRREVLDDVETITAYALDMSNFLHESELTERRAFIESFVKEIVVMPDNAVVRYTIPMPEDSPIGARDAEEMALNGSVLSTVKFGGPDLTVDRTIFELWLSLAG